MCQIAIEIGQCNAGQVLKSRGWGKRKARPSRDTLCRQAFRFSRLRRFGPTLLFFFSFSPPNGFWRPREDMIPDIPWRHLLRASLRECTYLPDPVARSYMRGYVLDRYRRASGHTGRPETQKIQQARQGLSVLQRANQGYQSPLEKVLFLSYGRNGKRRHELLVDFLKPPVPKDTDAVKARIAQPGQFEDGWEAPAAVMDLVKSQMHNGMIMSSRLRPRVTRLQPEIPEKNAWGRPLPLVRRRNIRKKWYQLLLSSLYPPLPEKELGILDGLLSGTMPWKPVKRRREPSVSSTSTSTPTDNNILDFLADGPQKGHTFREYVQGRPHSFTPRFMHRQWRRISAYVPRMFRIPNSDKLYFNWDTPKPIPSLASYVIDEADIDDIFGAPIPSNPRPKRQTIQQS